MCIRDRCPPMFYPEATTKKGFSAIQSLHYIITIRIFKKKIKFTFSSKIYFGCLFFKCCRKFVVPPPVFNFFKQMEQCASFPPHFEKYFHTNDCDIMALWLWQNQKQQSSHFRHHSPVHSPHFHRAQSSMARPIRDRQ